MWWCRPYVRFIRPIQFARRHDCRRFLRAVKSEFRETTEIPLPVSRIALLTLKGRNEDKVRFQAPTI